jgi:glycosyltransferase involved in cell wall biosynthesis
MILLSLVIPCYNEAENIPVLLERATVILNHPQLELIIVNNGSTDNTASILSAAKLAYPQLTLVTLASNCGYGNGILTGLAKAQGRYVGWTHADLQTDPADILQALPYLNMGSQAAFIKGRRYGRKWQDLFFTVGMSLFESCLLLTPLWDINAQPTLLPREFYQAWKNPPADFSLDLYSYYLAKRTHLTIIRFPVHFAARQAGEAHLKNLPARLRYMLKTMRYSLGLRKHLAAQVHA